MVEAQLRDTAVENETTYYYVVRSAGGDRPPWRESTNSNEASATPIDLTPPAPPQGLTAIPAPGVVSVSWTANAEPDLFGYLVYRRELPSLIPVRLTANPVQTTTFTDRAVRSGAAYIYTVTAVDRSSRRNESSPSPEVTVEVP
jgi:fibronectin type 3 domain-containing protein